MWFGFTYGGFTWICENVLSRNPQLSISWPLMLNSLQSFSRAKMSSLASSDLHTFSNTSFQKCSWVKPYTRLRWQFCIAFTPWFTPWNGLLRGGCSGRLVHVVILQPVQHQPTEQVFHFILIWGQQGFDTFGTMSLRGRRQQTLHFLRWGLHCAIQLVLKQKVMMAATDNRHDQPSHFVSPGHELHYIHIKRW